MIELSRFRARAAKAPTSFRVHLHVEVLEERNPLSAMASYPYLGALNLSTSLGDNETTDVALTPND